MKAPKLIFILFLLSLIFISFQVDIEIARSLFNPTNSLGQFIENYGNTIAYSVGLFGLLGLSLNEDNIVKKSLIQTLVIFLIITNVVLLSNHTSLKLSDTLVLSFFLSYLMYILLKRVKQFKSSAFKQWFKLTVLSFSLLTVIINLMKLFLFRIRPYLYMEGCLDYHFTLKWFAFNLNENFRSFPSFHVAMSAMLFVFVYFPNLKQATRSYIWFISFAWLIFVAYERMVMGAHFLSDTLVSSLIAFIVIDHRAYKLIKAHKHAN